MVLSKDYVLKLIGDYSRTPTGKKEIAMRTPDKLPFILQYETSPHLKNTQAEAKRLGQEMAEILVKHMKNDTVSNGVTKDGKAYKKFGLSEFEVTDIKVSKPIKITSGKGAFSVNLSIPVKELHRDSLNPNNNGIDDVVKLFVHGYSMSSAPVHGKWEKHGIEITAPRRWEGNSFLNNAVEEFNALHKGIAKATLKPEYVKKKER